MKIRTPAHSSSPWGRTSRAFTLVELIGVLAIMAILAATIAPNVIRMMDRAVVESEVRSLKAVATYLDEYARENDAFPAPPANPLPAPSGSTWQTTLVRYADVSSPDILWNKRGLERRYLVDTANPRRALLVSSLNDGLPIPAFIDFNSVWDTRDGQVPATFGGAWTTTADAGRYLVIQRVNLTTSQRTYAIYLANRSHLTGDAFAPGGNGNGNNGNGNGNGGGNNGNTGNGNGNNGNGNGNGGSGGTGDTGGSGGPGGTGNQPAPTPAAPVTAHYRVIRDRQPPAGLTIPLLPGEETYPALELRANDQVELYDDAGELQMVYVVSTTGRNFVFNNQHEWRPL